MRTYAQYLPGMTHIQGICLSPADHVAGAATRSSAGRRGATGAACRTRPRLCPDRPADCGHRTATARAGPGATRAPPPGHCNTGRLYKPPDGLQWHCAECAAPSGPGVSELLPAAPPRGQRQPLSAPLSGPGRWSSSWTPPASTREVCLLEVLSSA